MKISQKDWQNYIGKLRKINNTAADKVAKYMRTHDCSTKEGIEALLDYSYAVATKYGEGAAALACQMYEEVAEASGRVIPAAEPAATATYGETAKAVRGRMFDTVDPDAVGASVGRLVKMAGVDTTMKNALRDGAEWAWIPQGDTCAFCLMLASNGWQKASKEALKGGHAEHIHNNCDCTYQIRFDEKSTVEGYDPDTLYDEYIGSGTTRQERLNAIRRKLYAKNPEYYRAQKRAAYARRQTEYKGIPKKWEMVETPSDDFALKGVNPNYKKGIPEDMIDVLADYNNNCTNAVVAYDMRCRRYNVTACSVSECSALKKKLFTAWKGREPSTAKGKGYEEIVEYLSKKESGTRVAVTIEFQHYSYSTEKRHGHAFIMEKRGANILIVNPQSGSIITDRIFDKARQDKTRYMRIDDLEISDRGVSACKPVK